MKPRWQTALGLALTAWLGAACSAIVKDVVPNCEDGCDALNRHEGLSDTACIYYQCRADQKGCELRPRDADGDGHPDQVTCADAGLPAPLDCDDSSDASAPDAEEQCDGVDNNCDGVIDEGAFAKALKAPVRRDDVPLERGLAGVDATILHDGRLDLLFRYGGGRLMWWSEGAARPAALDTTCDVVSTTQMCLFVEVARAAGVRGVLSVGVETNGCREGHVRVGASFDASDPVTWQLDRTSQIRTGVDMDPARPTRACTSQRGAADLSLAVLPGDRDQLVGLAAWRDRDLEEPGPAALRILGLALRSATGSRVVQASQAGHSEALVDSAGEGAPALWAHAGDSESGYVLAYATPHTVELAFLPAKAAVSEPLLPNLRVGAAIAAEAAEELTLAGDTRAEDPDTGALAVAYRSKNGQLTRISLRPLQLRLGLDPPLLSGAGYHVDVQADAVVGPRLLYTPDGFRSAETGSRGGWFITWIERLPGSSRLMAVRVAQESSQALEPPFLVFESDTLDRLFELPRPLEGLGYGFVAGQAQPNLYIGSLACEPPAQKAR